MLGDKSVGKTCIVKRYTEREFEEDVEATIGSSFSSCVVKIKPQNVLEEVKVRLQIWDTAGEDRFRALTPIYYKNAAAVVLCYDISNSESFDSLSYWINEINNNNRDANILICLVGNKVDMADQ